MKLSSKAKKIQSSIKPEATLKGDLKKIARDIKKDHELAMELWSTEEYLSRLLAILIMDKKLITQVLIDRLDKEMQIHSFEEKNYLMEWLMANQLMKDNKTIALIESWEDSPSTLQRRTFWYYQARLRWKGQTTLTNTPELISKIESKITSELPEVQWVMNLTAGWIGVYNKKYRNQCIKIGENSGLFKDEVVSKGCTPNYLPEFIKIEVKKGKVKK
ncbi:MAG: DNA alkylation repair protein [Leptospiraceae bacterium]|nr:DNA alkylation repair protein [Leptospiraceae bacterium]